MYALKKFAVRPEEEVFSEIDKMAEFFPGTRKVFLADGNAVVLGTTKLLKILQYLKLKFPFLNRISSYAIPKDLKNETIEELMALQEAGLKLIYVGVETGDDQLLKLLNKGETVASTSSSMNKIKEAGIKCSVMIINGLGGRKFSRQHASNSAKVINQIQPEYLSTLVLSFPFGVGHFRTKFGGEFVEMNILDLLEEQKLFISNLALKETVFRSDHASNYLVLKGILNRDQNILLNKLDVAIKAPEHAGLRKEWERGL